MPVSTPSDAAAPPRRLVRGRRRSLIGLTPLIDVVFILLVFFMLASSFLDWRAVTLEPAITGNAAVETPPTAIAVIVEAEGVSIDGRLLADRDAARALTERLRDVAAPLVLLEPADAVSLQRLVSVLERLAAAGVAPVRLVPVDAPAVAQ